MIYDVFEKDKLILFYARKNSKTFLTDIEVELQKMHPINNNFSWDVEFLSNDQYQAKVNKKDKSENIDLTILKIEDEDSTDIKNINDESEYSEVLQLLKSILNQAIKKGASDIHIFRKNNSLFIKFRIEGQLKLFIKKRDLDQHLQRRLIALLRNRAIGINSLEKRKPGSGKIMIKYENKTIDIRVEIVNTGIKNGTEAVLRILERKYFDNLNDLGFNLNDAEYLKKAIREKRGMILVTGATGSGKSTTALTLLKDIKEDEGYNILTAENPIEGEIDGARQFQIAPEKGVTYPILLKSFLRMDPDILFIGEIRDTETAKIALQASQTGHIVIATLHTSSVSETRSRLKGLGISENDVNEQLKIILTQRLIFSENYNKRIMVYEIGKENVVGKNIEEKIVDLYEKGIISEKEKEVNICQTF